MKASALTFLEIQLRDPNTEERFFRWWDAARAFLRTRGRLLRAELAVLARGHYIGTLWFPLPGGWGLLSRDHAWRELLNRELPLARIETRVARLWSDEAPRSITGSELERWLDERSAGDRDFLLVDTLGRASYAKQHIPGAINLPYDEMDDELTVRRVLGEDRGRPIVVYCSSYG